MLLNKKQLTNSLYKLADSDYGMLYDILTEYVELIDTKRFNDLEEYVNNNINELMWYC